MQRRSAVYSEKLAEKNTGEKPIADFVGVTVPNRCLRLRHGRAWRNLR